MTKTIFLVLLLILSITSAFAITTNLKNEYNRGENFLLELNILFKQPIGIENVRFLRNHVDTSMGNYKVLKINDKTYITTQIPLSKEPGEYTIQIRNAQYFQNGEWIDTPIQESFTILSQGTLFSISPGLQKVQGNYELTIVNNFGSSFSLEYETINKETQEKTKEGIITLGQGIQKKTFTPTIAQGFEQITFNYQDSTETILAYITIPENPCINAGYTCVASSTTCTGTIIPYISCLEGKTCCDIPEEPPIEEPKENNTEEPPIEEPQENQTEEPTIIEKKDCEDSGYTCLKTNEECKGTKKENYTCQEGEFCCKKNLNIWEIFTGKKQECEEEGFTCIDKDNKCQGTQKNYDCNSDEICCNEYHSCTKNNYTCIDEDKNCTGTIKTNFKCDANEICCNEEESEEEPLPTNKIKTCEELGYQICPKEQTCSKETISAGDGKCCPGTCAKKETSSNNGKIIGWALIVIIALFIAWFFKARFKHLKRSPIELEEIGSRTLRPRPRI